MDKQFREFLKTIANQYIESSIFEQQRKSLVLINDARKKAIDFININNGVSDLKLAVYMYKVIYNRDLTSTLTFFEKEGYATHKILKLLEVFYGKEKI